MDRGRRAIPTLNKHTDTKYYQKCQEIHQKKLLSIKSTINNSEPHRPVHFGRNLKKEQLKEERYAEIDRENRILLEKMEQIMQNETGEFKPSSSVRYGHSLNKDLRKRQLHKITQENQAILNRIQMQTPTYDHLQWEEDARQNQKIARNISEFASTKPKDGNNDRRRVTPDDSFL